jgi:hypothetical protein
MELAAIASAQADAGVRDGARDTLELLLTTVFEPEYERERSMILSTVAEVQAKLGDLGAALASASRADGLFWRAQSLFRIVRALD